jgi:hypothetical protein
MSVPLTIILASLSTISLAGSTNNKSPYFIDGMRCEGLEGTIDEEKLGQNFPDKEVAAVGIKALRQTQCEAIFHQYNVDKFQWVTPEDLEALSFFLRHGKKFASVDIRIEKSELQNHVYLIGQFKPFAPKNHYS